ncbi:hypothetical protein HII31_12726 [Pseudocercospora fuligena]|uniref:Carbohydrate-binding module family 1 protein n=1 Tax=Pseudocercospora fuligena TaxID=685502 RepID=A0A8H6R7A5_9PEZI|nr:hypothetical protein HII31_12726 [Pseudocercospora fuligena]
MAPIITYLTTTLILLNNVSLCSPLPHPQEIAHQDEVLKAIGTLKSEITSDPKGITKSWTVDENGNETSGKKSKSSNNNNNEEDQYEKQQKEYQEQQKEYEEQQEEYEEQQNYPSEGGGSECGEYPGQHGKCHSSGTHSTANWPGCGPSGCWSLMARWIRM